MPAIDRDRSDPNGASAERPEGGLGAGEEAASFEVVEVLRGHRAGEPRVERTQKDAELLDLAHHAERVHHRGARLQAAAEDFFADALSGAGAVVAGAPRASAGFELVVDAALVCREMTARHARGLVERERRRSIECEPDATKRSTSSAIGAKIVHDEPARKPGECCAERKIATFGRERALHP